MAAPLKSSRARVGDGLGFALGDGLRLGLALGDALGLSEATTGCSALANALVSTVAVGPRLSPAVAAPPPPGRRTSTTTKVPTRSAATSPDTISSVPRRDRPGTGMGWVGDGGIGGGG